MFVAQPQFHCPCGTLQQIVRSVQMCDVAVTGMRPQLLAWSQFPALDHRSTDA